MRKPGFTISTPPGQRKAMIGVARELERRGFPHLFCPHEYARPSQSPAPYDSLSLCTAVIQATHTIKVGSGLAVTRTRHATDMAAAATFNGEISDGRFYLGLGVGYDSVLQRFGIAPVRPIEHLRRYLADLRTAAAAEPLPPILLGALRRGMLRLAGEIADGALAANWALSHVPESLKEIPAHKRDTFIIGNIAPVWVSDDRGEGLAVMRRLLAAYIRIPTYAAYFREAGYHDEVTHVQAALAQDDRAAAEACIPLRMAEDIGIFGAPAEVREKIAAWWAAGVEWLTLSTLYPSRNRPEAIMRVAQIFE